MNKRDITTLRRAASIVQKHNDDIRQGESQWLNGIYADLLALAAAAPVTERLVRERRAKQLPLLTTTVDSPTFYPKLREA